MEYNLEGLLSKQTYENGNYVNFYYDTLDRLTEKVYNGDSSKKISYYYGNDGSVSYCMDYMENTTTRYVYDLAGRVVKLKVYNGTTFKCLEAKESVTYKYADKTNYVTSVTYTSALGTQTVNYGYGSLATETMPDTVYTVSQNGTEQIEYIFDYLSRLSSRTISPINKTQTYTYKQGGHGSNSTTTQVASVTSDGITTSYTYDSLGNITAIHKNNQLYESYEYDALSQLTKVTTASGDVYEYTYKGSNITSVKLNGSTIKTYSYGNSEWADLLTEYNGESISYDSIGNPLKYRNGMNFTWQNGRQLSGITKSGNSISYTYNADGLRTSKVVNGTTTNYTYIHGRLIGEKTGNNTIIYLYDDNGNKYGLTYNGTSYYYKLNLQGDVIGIYDASGNTVVEYSYDVWGKLVSVTGSLASTIGQINPIRYRGYYYDTETGFYYCNTRYYDPEIGRFINADSVISGTGESVQGYNLFAYCFNNPVNMSDSSGNWPKWLEKAAVVVSAVVVVAAVVVTVAAVTAYTAGTGTAAAVYGASILLGASLSGINGAVANASKGNSYLNGYCGGFVSGATQSFCSKYPGGTVWGGTIGTGAGTAITDGLNNLDPDSSNSSGSEIIQNVSVSAAKATITSMQTALIGSGVGGINYSTGELVGGVADQCGGLMPGLTLGFGEGIKAFFGAVDDAMVYIWN